jgi:uncharacterized membrane protein
VQSNSEQQIRFMPDRSTRIPVAGESWNIYAVQAKGPDPYAASGDEEGARDLLIALQLSVFDITYLRNHEEVETLPYEAAEFSGRSDVVVLSDMSAHSLLLPHADAAFDSTATTSC